MYLVNKITDKDLFLTNEHDKVDYSITIHEVKAKIINSEIKWFHLLQNMDDIIPILMLLQK